MVHMLGPRLVDGGARFAVFSSVAEAVELCVFGPDGEEQRQPLAHHDGDVWVGTVEGVRAGQLYGFRVRGPYEPSAGLFCDPNRLLMDPYARALSGRLRYADEALLRKAAPRLDTAGYVPRSVLVDESFDWGDDARPQHAWNDSIIYELHVKGFSASNPEVPPPLRGTYAGLRHPASIEYLKKLGVTAVELLPVHHFDDDAGLSRRGLSNYWGYSSLGFFAPHGPYCSQGGEGQQVAEFKGMVKALHAAGIEVILDVVYNHTVEGDERGVTVCLRGFDNRAYYKVLPDAPGRYLDHTGCGNTLNTRHPRTLQLILDSLRYWVQEMHVDGFRFDLAPALTRTTHWVDPYSSFFSALLQDPVLTRVKLIAEPWDLGSDGYQLGHFPAQFSEWNGRYRDVMRSYWCQQQVEPGEFARRLCGSEDIFRGRRRGPHAGVNFVTCHDGFTLLDLNTYEHKRNQANNEDNRDGDSHNRSWNCGHEGPDAPEAVQLLRRRQQRNLLTTLLLSHGVPMLLAGDELGRTQQGNNNAYCQDNALSYIDWQHKDEDLLAYVRRLTQLLKDNPGLRPPVWLDGAPTGFDEHRDVEWFHPDGRPFGVLDWDRTPRKALTVHRGRHVSPTRPCLATLFLVNPEPTELTFVAPPGIACTWQLWLDAAQQCPPKESVLHPGESVTILPHSCQLYVQVE